MRRLRASLTLAAGLTLALSSTAGAAGPGGSRFQHVDPGKVDLRNVDSSLLFAANPAKIEKVIVELGARPVALHTADAKAHGQQLSASQKAGIRASIKSDQTALLPSLRGLGAKVLAQYQDAYNGIKVQIAAEKVAALTALPGVTGVHKVAVYQMSNEHGVPYIGAPTAWGSYSLTGAGVKVGIIDTGIDYTHADFGGAGTAAAYAAQDSTTLADGGFPSAKVAGGTDFVGNAYNASGSGSQLIPNPDPDPLDCAGHGSHVSGTAAGEGVLADGSTYTGPYDASTVSGNSWKVGPGVAPEATLYAYKVFGCAGSTDVVTDAINQAVADGMDVINMSLGSPFGGTTEPDVVASNNASLAGTVVVASAGNNGPNPEITGSPASADRALSVAAMDASFIEVGQIQDLPGMPYGQFDTTVNTLPVTGTINDRLVNPTTLDDGCQAGDFTGLGAGDIAVVTRGACTFAIKGQNAQAAGASALIVVNTANGTIPPGGVGTLAIPVFIFGLEFKPALLGANGTSHTIVDTMVQSPTIGQTASFSSGGPRYGDNAVKPEIAAPGQNVVSAGVGTGSGSAVLSGTSMAAPHTTGSAALVVQAHPSWSAEAVKAALINTANASSANPGGIVGYNLRLDGSGVVDASKANTVAYATTTGGTDTLSFGYQPLSTSFSGTLPMTVWNTSGSAISYSLANAANASVSGLSVSVSPSSVTVPANGSRTVNVHVQISSAGMAALASISTAIASPAIQTARGAIVATPTSTGTGVYALRIPWLVTPRGLSNVTATAHGAYSLSGGIASASVPLGNSGVHDGVADVYAWGLSDPNDGLPENDIRAAGVQVLPGAAGGLPASDRLLVFAINTWGRWGNAGVSEYDVLIDTNRDGNVDYYVIGFDHGALTSATGQFDGLLWSFVFDASFNLIDEWTTTAPTNGSTVELPASASDLGLSSGSGSFDYSVDIFDQFTGDFDFSPTVAHFDAYTPAVSTGDFIGVPAKGTKPSLPVWVDKASFNGGNSALGWMVVALDDANGAAQADLVPVGTLP